MSKPLLPVLLLCLAAATSAHAQYGGGGGGGHRGGGGGRNKSPPPSTSTASPTPDAPPDKPLKGVSITGVIQSIDSEHGRVTIAYDDVDALNWPAGTKPFVVENSEVLKDRTVGEKVRFQLDSQQISEMSPY